MAQYKQDQKSLLSLPTDFCTIFFPNSPLGCTGMDGPLYIKKDSMTIKLMYRHRAPVADWY